MNICGLNLKDLLKIKLQRQQEVKLKFLPTFRIQKLKKTTARIANTLNTLEKKGFIIRIQDKNDRRKILVQITPEGIRYEEGRRREALKNLTCLLEAMGEHDAKEHLRLVKKIHNIMELQLLNKNKKE